jgi:Cu2+-exporting ATPase
VVAVADLRPGDLIRVRPGARVPADGVVTEGTSELDRSLLTGETLPAPAGPGAALSAGETNLTGPLTLRVTAAGRDSSLARMAELVAVAETTRNRYTTIADRAARAYSPLVHLLSFMAFGYWMWATGGDVRFAVNISAAVLIITCPCALGLAVPAVVTAASGRLFRKGLLIKSGSALERLAAIDTVVFDKTGTLTMGTPEPRGLQDIPPDDRAIAAALAAASAHPLAASLARATRAMGIAPAAVTDLREIPGEGVEGRLNGRPVRLGRASWTGADPVAETATYLMTASGTRAIPFADRLRPGAAETVAALKAQGIAVHLISGDAPAPVADIAARLGIPHWRAETRPEGKAAAVAALAAGGAHVLMVGDGLNDTAALAAAHASLSPASALDAARTASDIVLLGQSLAPVADALETARQSVRRMRENLWISAAYNVVAVPVALVGLATPLLAALAMSTSSITVGINALRLPGGRPWKS